MNAKEEADKLTKLAIEQKEKEQKEVEVAVARIIAEEKQKREEIHKAREVQKLESMAQSVRIFMFDQEDTDDIDTKSGDFLKKFKERNFWIEADLSSYKVEPESDISQTVEFEFKRYDRDEDKETVKKVRAYFKKYRNTWDIQDAQVVREK